MSASLQGMQAISQCTKDHLGGKLSWRSLFIYSFIPLTLPFLPFHVFIRLFIHLFIHLFLCHCLSFLSSFISEQVWTTDEQNQEVFSKLTKFSPHAAAAAAAKSLQSCPTLCDPIDGSPPGSSVPEILQARTLEWVAISFSNAWKWKVKGKSLSRAQLLATPWTAAYQAPPSMGFSRQEYWSWVPVPSP